MKTLESRLGWNVGRKPRRQEKRRPIGDGDGAPKQLLKTLWYHEAWVLSDAVEQMVLGGCCRYVLWGESAEGDTGGDGEMPGRIGWAG